MGMTEGTVVQWLKKVGDHVALGETVAVVETEKVEVELEAQASGILAEILVTEGETVPVLSVLAYLEE
jgi:2-oxoglutarate dehydrogenase E2 component (dihydrolipoamide succinyltransferase)